MPSGRPPRANTWDAHPVLAWWVRAGILLVPVGVSVLAALALIAVLPDPDGGVEVLSWWLLVLGCGLGVAHLVDRLARRALPLAILLRLSLVFPDRAPSRMRAARRTSLREIEHQVAALRSSGSQGEPAEAARTLVMLVGALGLHDKRTRGHSERVRAYVDMLTEQLRLPEHDRARLRWAALLHDIGKLSVPQPVLNGGSDLAEEDWAALRRHPVEGERLAGGLLPWLGEWGLCVREHHERWDGSGYPEGLAGEQISFGARIVAVADAYEVMTANRSYRSAVSPGAAREELARCAGTDFDPMVVRAFLQISLGRLRSVLGPLALLPALPFAAAADRVGQVGKGLTTMAAVGSVALAVSGTAVVHPSPVLRTPAAAPPVVAAPREAGTPEPRRTPVVARVGPAQAASEPDPVLQPPPQPRSSRTPPPSPAPHRSQPPAEARVLYLSASGALVIQTPPEGGGIVPQGGAGLDFSVGVTAPLTLEGSPSVLFWTRVSPRHGSGHPRASITVVLQDCDTTRCRTLAHGTMALKRGSPQRLSLSRLDTVVPAGHRLRLAVAVVARDNVNGVLVSYGGAHASRLDLR